MSPVLFCAPPGPPAGAFPLAKTSTRIKNRSRDRYQVLAQQGEEAYLFLEADTRGRADVVGFDCSSSAFTGALKWPRLRCPR